MALYIYEVYEDNKLDSKHMTEERAREVCINLAAIKVESLKRKVYYPILFEKYKVTRIKDIPAEIRYKFWEEENYKYLKEHFYIKKKMIRTDEDQKQRLKEFQKKYKKELGD